MAGVVARVPVQRGFGTADIGAALARGWADFMAAPLWGLFFGAVFAAGGLLLWSLLAVWDRPWWILPLGMGFPLLGPFAAVGLYEISRRREAGESLEAGAILGAVFRQKDRQLPSMVAVILGFFLVWLFVAHTIFALFLGVSPASRFSDATEMLLSPDGLAMLAFGSLVGAGFALLLFSITVVSLPLLLEREVDFVTAMIASVGAVRQSPGPMLLWGLVIAVLTFLAFLPAFLGLLVVFPLLGHATWHVYRRAIA